MCETFTTFQQKMAEHLRELSKIYSYLEDKRRSDVYLKAAFSLEKADQNVDPIKLKGIGPSISKDLKEFKETGTSARMTELKNSNKEYLEAIEAFLTIHGIGIAFAKKLYLSGYRTLEQLKDCPHLSNVQKQALEQVSDLQEKIPRKEIQVLENILNELCGDNFVITGSYRRKHEFSSDIDILTKINIDEFMFNIVDFIESDLVVGKVKYMGTIKIPGFQKIRRIDVMFIPEENWPFALLYFTGSKEFNINMRQEAKNKGFKLNEFGIKDIKKDEFIHCKEEQNIFELLQIKYVLPEDR